MSADAFRARTCELWRVHNPDLDTSAMEVVGQVKRITALLEHSVEPIYRQAALSATEVELLVPLRYTDEPITAIRLAERLGMSRAGVSKVLAKLERRELITRELNPDDRRSALIRMTNEGRSLIDDVFPRELETHRELLEGLGRSRKRVLEALDSLAEHMDTRMQILNAVLDSELTVSSSTQGSSES